MSTQARPARPGGIIRPMDERSRTPGMRAAVEELETGRRLGGFVGNLLLRLIGLGLLAGLGFYLWNVLDVPNLPIVTKLGLSPSAPLASRIEILPVSPTYEELVAVRGREPTPAPLVPVEGIAPGTVRPDYIAIPAIELDAAVVPVGFVKFEQPGGNYVQWQVPDEYAVGWHGLSAGLGETGNTVLNGHNNVFGEVFRFLDKLVVGDAVNLYAGSRVFTYEVTETVIFAERDQPMDVRVANAQWIAPTDDERVTLVSCYPYSSNTHRLVVVARPIGAAPEMDLDFEPDVLEQ